MVMVMVVMVVMVMMVVMVVTIITVAVLPVGRCVIAVNRHVCGLDGGMVNRRGNLAHG